MSTRREFLEKIAATTGAIALFPVVTSCKKKDAEPPATVPGPDEATAAADSHQAAADPTRDTGAGEKAAPAKVTAPPTQKPADWNAMTFNRERGAAGAIPASYMDDITGADGDSKHLGKHLPYTPKLDDGLVPEGFIALMWGDPDKGHAKHPNAPKGPDNNNEGHWYNWIRVRKAIEGDAEEIESTYTDWPGTGEGDNGKYVAFGGGELTADGGRNTVYLAAVPSGIKSGDTVRVWAHCLTHGEYVDFLTIA